MNKENSVRGFTLFELLLSLAIVGLLLGVGAPTLFSLQAKFESIALQSDLRRMLVTARHYAVAEKRTVTLCGTDAQQHCVDQGFAELTVFIDDNRNRALDEEERIIAVADIRYRGELSLRASSNSRHIGFSADGSATRAGSFLFCRAGYPRNAGRVTVSMAGRAYAGIDRDGDGVVELTSGDPISC